MTHKTDTPLDLDAIEAYCAAATEGPWTPGEPTPAFVWMNHAYGPGCHASLCIKSGREKTPKDAAFIAHARTDLPACVAEIRRLRKQLEEIKHAQYDQWCMEEESDR